MPTVSSRVGVIALVLFVLCLPPHTAAAFGLRLGPFHFGLPTPGLSRHHRIARSEPDVSLQRQKIDRPVLFYPILVWPSLAGATFWPHPNDAWPFGYDNIVDEAFAKYSGEQAAEPCTDRDATPQLIARVQRDIDPRTEQKPLLEQLATSLGQANGYLIKSCPTKIPLSPVARLQLMEAKIDATIMALEIVRPPLQNLERALDEKQRARWDAAATAGGEDTLFCTGKNERSEGANWPLPQLQEAVHPTDEQRKALALVDQAFKRAASGLAAECTGAIPKTASGRLVATEDWLDTTWRAVETIEAALANFQKDLSDEQKARINALEIASTR